MKVISGTLKGRTIEGFHNKGTRPTMDRVKESLFAMIQENIKDSIVLDLFSGSGNLAIESLSQGASFAYCNDAGREAIKIIRRNMEHFSLTEQVTLLNLDFKKALSVLKDKNVVFDIIFLDPPYQTNCIKESLFLIEKYQLLKENGKIICETDDLSKIPQNITFRVLKSKKYGDKYVVILK